ncbi:MAG: amidohydrolase family protein [Anaerolineaceae bacterium]|nr:amidohydrolase family protein [Anaerolineaceae bacterium]
MIIDSHCHAWTRWPYQPPVPDDEHRAKIEQLINEMDLNGIDQAAVVCAQIDHNPENNTYIAEQVTRFPTRLHQIADLDSEWAPTYHTAGSANRLKQMLDQWPLKGFTHYLKPQDNGAWLYSDEGQKVFQVAAEHTLFASISCEPQHQPAIRKIAEMFPSVPVLCHHMGWIKAAEPAPKEGLNQVLESAKIPNIYIKLSGFAYATRINWDYPYEDTHDIVRAEYEHFGAERMCWGSDYPVVRFYMTYKQALEAFRYHCTFISDADKEQILGGTLAKLLG